MNVGKNILFLRGSLNINLILILPIAVVLFVACSGGSTQETTIVTDEADLRFPCAEEVPSWWKDSPSGSEYLTRKGISNPRFKEQDAIEEALNNARIKIAQFAGNYVRTQAQQTLTAVETEHDVFLKTVYDETVESTAQAVLNHEQTNYSTAYCEQTGAWKAWAIVTVNEHELLGTQKLLRLSWDILYYDENEQAIKSMRDGDTIPINSWFKIVVQANSKAFVYIMNWDKTSGAGFFYLPAKSIVEGNVLDMNSPVQIPIGDMWGKLAGAPGTTEAFELIAFTVGTESHMDPVQECIQTYAMQESYQVPNLVANFTEQINTCVGNDSKLMADWYVTKPRVFVNPVSEESEEYSINSRSIIGTAYFCRDIIHYTYQ
jgi:hypothetical protein